ncbi:sigma-70 family RNA polymerase sigma factor [Kibdelosporangium phytohabitans]|uniref:sigma-70 family RNA polymerase sigma factor n=1 Tax=Kibdelosporangium phytohabitans TaxID=860235 RepID=UPI000A54F6D2|nr:sigma-70 family RNA polymerase sigma factor [Kibdelosporangium phytohabitans]MBE1461077.1 RNA polymerase sigma-70 factor (ECF subfamily) [Kibdelosporangium phytohabitans]
MTRSLSSTDDEFQRSADPYRAELLAHCYRMLGSVHEAEDLVQETYLKAWRGFGAFEGRSSIRTWLYRIATNACLSALQGRERRPLPVGLSGDSGDPAAPLVERSEVPWLEPFPDTMLDPAAVVTARETVRLAFIAALQYLPPRQRAVLVLRDVLRWQAAEVADMLGTTTAAVNSALQRAHAQLASVTPTPDDVVEPTGARQRELLERFMAAFEAKDIPAIVAVFTDDAVMQMPPFAHWYRGGEAIARLVRMWCPAHRDDLRLVPIRGNGQPGFATYMRGSVIGGASGSFVPWKLELLELDERGVRQSVSFFDTSLFAVFGLPALL